MKLLYGLIFLIGFIWVIIIFIKYLKAISQLDSSFEEGKISINEYKILKGRYLNSYLKKTIVILLGAAAITIIINERLR